ncbi:hypothetical protein C8R47DRAFT_1017328 [Mycena vitilis]|nr:hypothetical protein C8R47DRAFT_1017328 [Mycena vitilis]
MTHGADLKESEVHTTGASIPPPVPPPYESGPVPSETIDDPDAGTSPPTFTRPGNNIVVSRTFGAVKGVHFTVDPNIRLPKSLLRPAPLAAFPKPRPNLELNVEFGGIDAEVDVLPLIGEVPPDENAGFETPMQKVDPRKVRLKATTATGNITLHVNAPPTAPISLHVSTSFGHVRVYLPRTMHGPLTLSSSLRSPLVSPSLRRACTPLREEGLNTYCFVGDIGAWTAKDEMGDEVKVYSEFGRVWVGYVGEDEHAAPVRRRGSVRMRLQLGSKTLGAILLLWAAYWVLVRFFAWQMA